MAGMVLVLTTALSAADIDGNDVNHRPRYSAFFLCSDKQHPSRAAQETYQRPETSLQLEPEKKNERDVVKCQKMSKARALLNTFSI